MPQHVAVGAGVGSTLHLLGDVGLVEVRDTVREGLDPWADGDAVGPGEGDDAAHALEHEIVWVVHGVLHAQEIAEKVGRVEHGAGHVEQRQQVGQMLAGAVAIG